MSPRPPKISHDCKLIETSVLVSLFVSKGGLSPDKPFDRCTAFCRPLGLYHLGEALRPCLGFKWFGGYKEMREDIKILQKILFYFPESRTDRTKHEANKDLLRALCRVLLARKL